MEQAPIKSEVRERMDSKFRYVLVVAERAEQLLRGGRAKLDAGETKPTRVAQEEIDRELIAWDYGPAPMEATEDVLEAPAEEGDEVAAAPDDVADEAAEADEEVAESAGGADEETEVH